MTNGRILMLQREGEERRQLSRALRRAGYSVIVTDDRKEALRRLAAQPVDLILFDYRLFEGDRIRFLASAKWRFPEAARLMITTDTEREVAIKALRSSMVHLFITRPFSEQMLMVMVREILAWTGRRAFAFGNASSRGLEPQRAATPQRPHLPDLQSENGL